MILQCMTLNISKDSHLGYLNLKIYSPINFGHGIYDIYFNDIDKTKKFQKPCRLRDFKIP